MWSYSGDPANDPTDEVRFLVGDTITTDPQVQNEEIDAFLTMFPKQTGKPAWLAAAATADAIASMYARQIDSSISSLSQTASQRFEHYRQLADRLRTMYLTDGQGDAVNTLRIVPAAAVLGGGGPTVLGNNQLPYGGAGGVYGP